MDYYNLLGVNKTSSADEIKRAYRSKAMKHHPDRGGDPNTFKEINEAYETLSNPEKKAEYDNPQDRFAFNSRDFGRGRSPFEEAFTRYGFGQQTPRNRNVALIATLELEEVLSGKGLVMQYRLASGDIETVTVDVPAGAKSGDTVQYQGLGDNGNPRFPRGDLHVRVRVNKKNGWERDADNLITKKQVNMFDLLLGGVIIVNTLDKKKLELKIPQGTKTGQVFSITGHGVPNINTGRRGNLYVEINAEIPKITDKKLLEEISILRDKINKQ